MKIVANPLDIEIEGDDGATWGIDVGHGGQLRLYAMSASYRDRDNRDAWDEGEVEVDAEQAAEVMAALVVWFEQLPTKRMTRTTS